MINVWSEACEIYFTTNYIKEYIPIGAMPSYSCKELKVFVEYDNCDYIEYERHMPPKLERCEFMTEYDCGWIGKLEKL